jgi:alkylation response protein AidB-like acyl-CoA dehydrogenase
LTPELRYSTDDEPEAPTGDELIQRAESLVPLLRKNAIAAERLRRLPDESVRALDEAGIFRMVQPVHRGGFGTDPQTISKVTTLIASGCPSTTWIMLIYSAVAQLAELLPDEALAEMYASPHPKISGVFGRAGAVIEPVAGGYRVRGSGRWPFNSGCNHAQWDLLRLVIEEPAGSTWPAFAAVPLSDLTIVDDWNVMGASGTGSNSVTCEDLFIPEHRVTKLTTSDVRTVLREDLTAAHTAALPLGMTRYAFEAFRELAETHGIQHLGYERMVDAPVVHAGMGTAAVNIKLIEAFQQWAMSATDAETAHFTPEDTALRRVGSARCFRLARETIQTLFELCPSSEIHSERPIQRLLRDVYVFEHQHANSLYINNELYGRHLTEGPADAPA